MKSLLKAMMARRAQSAGDTNPKLEESEQSNEKPVCGYCYGTGYADGGMVDDEPEDRELDSSVSDEPDQTKEFLRQFRMRKMMRR